MLCFNFMLDKERAYQSITALQGIRGNSGSVLPLHEGTGSGLAIWIAKSGFLLVFFFLLFLNAEVKNVLLSCAALPSCLIHAHAPLPPTPAGLAQRSGEVSPA